MSVETDTTQDSRFGAPHVDPSHSPVVVVPEPGEEAGPKPPWSVLSLKRLLAAIRESARTLPLRNAEELERRRVRSELAQTLKREAAEQAWNDRYRNAWENS
jgi:hypothetical protein